MSETVQSIRKSGGGTRYSTSETEIGTWIDGRKRYRKVVTQGVTWLGGQTTSIDVPLNLSSNDVDPETITYSGSVLFGNINEGLYNAQTWGYALSKDGISDSGVYSGYSTTDGKYHYKCTLNQISSITFPGGKIIVIVEYCKPN